VDVDGMEVTYGYLKFSLQTAARYKPSSHRIPRGPHTSSTANSALVSDSCATCLCSWIHCSGAMELLLPGAMEQQLQGGSKATNICKHDGMVGQKFEEN
jgi:hypothetical protein